jgi:O-antigen/teichoic acid export membrane protein
MTRSAVKAQGVDNPAGGSGELATDHLLPDLKRRTISSGFITTAVQAVKFILNSVYIMVMARLLMPEDFGLVAMTTTIIGALRIFRDVGLSTAIIQRQDITAAQLSNLFWINVVVGALSGSITVVAAPIIAGFYGEQRLIRITILLAVTFLLSGLMVQHHALLSRQMRFKAIAVIDVGSMAAGYLTGVELALRGFGYWSLVVSMLTVDAVRAALTWWISRWRPGIPSRRSGIRPLLNFGASLTIGTFTYSVARGADSLLIGRYYGPYAVGLYSRASVLLMRPLEELLTAMGSVFVPALSRLQDQPARYRRTFLQLYEAVALVTFPLSALSLPLASPLILVVMGPKWQGSVAIFCAFTLMGVYFPLANVSTWLLVSQGRGRHWVFLTSAVSILTLASFMCGLLFGAAGVAFAYSASCLFLQLPLLYHVAGREGPVGTKDLWVGFLRQAPLWVSVAGATYLIRLPLSNSAPLTQLSVCCPAGLVFGILCIWISPPSRRVAVGLFALFQGFGRPPK